jgi:hypothetical protein
LALAFGAFSLVFVITHMVPFEGGAKALHATLQGQPLFDQHTAPTADAVYERLQSFGAAGREAYRRFTYTGDILFPLSLLLFLTVLAFFVRQRTAAPRALRYLLISLPFIWFLADMAENSMIYVLISNYPDRHMFLAGLLSTITTLKFTLLLGSIGVPAVLYGVFRK